MNGCREAKSLGHDFCRRIFLFLSFHYISLGFFCVCIIAFCCFSHSTLGHGLSHGNAQPTIESVHAQRKLIDWPNRWNSRCGNFHAKNKSSVRARASRSIGPTHSNHFEMAIAISFSMQTYLRIRCMLNRGSNRVSTIPGPDNRHCVCNRLYDVISKVNYSFRIRFV